MCWVRGGLDKKTQMQVSEASSARAVCVEPRNVQPRNEPEASSSRALSMKPQKAMEVLEGF